MFPDKAGGALPSVGLPHKEVVNHELALALALALGSRNAEEGLVHMMST